MATFKSSIFHPVSLLVFLFYPCWVGAIQPPGTINIAPLDQALTFARANNKTIAVLSYEGYMLKGIDLGDSGGDAIDLFNLYGYDELKARIESLRNRAESFDVRHLDIPVNLKDHNIATGTNYASHADEAELKQTPFLFCKLVQPTPPYSPVIKPNHSLDYEVEMAFVPLTDIKAGTLPDYMGIVLSNDYSNREVLMSSVEVGNIASGTGFAQGKSGHGLLPVGNLFVIPKNYLAFSQNIQLQLYVNQAQRQAGQSSQMIWNIHQILENIWAKRDVVWQYQGKQVRLLEQPETITARSLILSGTPEGTAFQGIPLKTKVTGVMRWVFSGFTSTVQQSVVDTYMEQAVVERRFLQTGDQVLAVANYLGVINNTIVDAGR